MLREEVLLIPRDQLAILPFGALLTQPESNLARPQNWHFLDNELVLSQTYSASQFDFVHGTRLSKSVPGATLALAPFATATSGRDPVAGDNLSRERSHHFEPLPNSSLEAEFAAQTPGSRLLLGREATRDAFIEASPGYKILHLATHSVANDIQGEYSFVALYGADSLQDANLLYARDIYSLPLPADRVVLSACETAQGQYRKDEGVVGLIRAFTCASARHVIASLWSVNDEATKKLMILFYTELRKGLPYNRALSNAKRAFIHGNKAFGFPYYWAGFVLHGR